eukprot:jgi/Tetstr1/463059/TSEL_007996.t1
MSILNQIVPDKQARTELLRFTNGTDPVVRGRKAIDALVATFLQSPRFRAETCNEALHMRMKTTEDLTDYEKRLNLVRMELACMDKAPDESKLVVAFIKGLRDEFRTAAQILSTRVVTATTLDAAVQHVWDSMLTVDPEPADQPTSTFAADNSSNVAIDSNAAILFTLKMLSTNMESMASSVARLAIMPRHRRHAHVETCPSASTATSVATPWTTSASRGSATSSVGSAQEEA